METEKSIVQKDVEGRFEKNWIEVFKKAPSSVIEEFESAVGLYHEKFQKIGICQHLTESAIGLYHEKFQKIGICKHLTPLHIAAITGHFSLYENLVDMVEDKNPLDNQGFKPLHYAAQYGHGNIVKTIVDKSERIKYKNNLLYSSA